MDSISKTTLNSYTILTKVQHLIIEAVQIEPLFNLLTREQLEVLYSWLEEEILKCESESDKKLYTTYLEIIDKFIST